MSQQVPGLRREIPPGEEGEDAVLGVGRIKRSFNKALNSFTKRQGLGLGSRLLVVTTAPTVPHGSVGDAVRGGLLGSSIPADARKETVVHAYRMQIVADREKLRVDSARRQSDEFLAAATAQLTKLGLVELTVVDACQQLVVNSGGDESVAMSGQGDREAFRDADREAFRDAVLDAFRAANGNAEQGVRRRLAAFSGLNEAQLSELVIARNEKQPPWLSVQGSLWKESEISRWKVAVEAWRVASRGPKWRYAGKWGYVAHAVGSRDALACKARHRDYKRWDFGLAIDEADLTRVQEYIAFGSPSSEGRGASLSSSVQITFDNKAAAFVLGNDADLSLLSRGTAAQLLRRSKVSRNRFDATGAVPRTRVRSDRRQWTEDEVARLKTALKQQNKKHVNWQEVADAVGGDRSARNCKQKFFNEVCANRMQRRAATDS
jgi:hypothetical protein